MKLDHHLIPHTRINSKWTKDLNVRSKTIKIIEANRSNNISDIAHRNCLLYISPQARKTKENIKKKWDLINLKKFLHNKGYHEQNKKTTYRMGKHIHRNIC